MFENKTEKCALKETETLMANSQTQGLFIVAAVIQCLFWTDITKEVENVHTGIIIGEIMENFAATISG